MSSQPSLPGAGAGASESAPMEPQPARMAEQRVRLEAKIEKLERRIDAMEEESEAAKAVLKTLQDALTAAEANSDAGKAVELRAQIATEKMLQTARLNNLAETRRDKNLLTAQLQAAESQLAQSLASSGSGAAATSSGSAAVDPSALLSALHDLRLEARETRTSLELRASGLQQRLEAVQAAQAEAQTQAAATQAQVAELRRAAPPARSIPSDSQQGKELLQHCPSKVDGVGSATGAALLTPEALDEVIAYLKRAPGSGSGGEAARAASDSQAVVASSSSSVAAGGRRSVWPNPLVGENSLVALLTPLLSSVCAEAAPDAVLVDSELLPWIHTDSGLEAHFQAPDLFLCHRAALVSGQSPVVTAKSKAPTVHADTIRNEIGRAHFVFGECAWPLQDAALCLLEAKREVTLNKHVGEVYPKLLNLLLNVDSSDSDSEREPGATRRCCLFDLRELHLLEFTVDGLRSYQHFAWVAEGSRAALVSFLRGATRPEWSRVLDALCSELRVQVLPTDSFLGAGAHGRVFAVRSLPAAGASASVSASAQSEPAVHALKIAKDAECIDALELEGTKLRGLVARSQQAAPDTAMAAVKPYLPTSVSELYRVSLPCGDEETAGAGLLLRPVGASVWPERRTLLLLHAVLLALLRLHLAGIAHGDPRMENLLRCGQSQLVWIDFRQQQLPEDYAVRSDFCMCVRSFFSRGDRSLPLEAAREEAKAYLAIVKRVGTTVSHLHAYVEQLWRKALPTA